MLVSLRVGGYTIELSPHIDQQKIIVVIKDRDDKSIASGSEYKRDLALAIKLVTGE